MTSARSPRLTVWLATASLGLLLVACWGPSERASVRPTLAPGARIVGGRVVSSHGEPVSGARVVVAGRSGLTDRLGRFALTLPGTGSPSPAWVTASHAGFLSRTRAAVAGSPVLIRLTPDDGRTISLHFTGDVMFGRRFYDPNEDGDTSDGLLQPHDGVAAHLALLSDIQPLLADADVTVVNMETPLVRQPYIDPTSPRPAEFHPTKTYVFASSPVSARALHDSGVDVIDIGNNHLYDALQSGVNQTLAALGSAGYPPGIGFFGGGRNEAEAWRPAVVRVKGQTIAFLGCTTVTRPFEHDAPVVQGKVRGHFVKGAISYVASGDSKGGAAQCNVGKIESAVREARARYDVVVFMVHGGIEYWREQSATVVEMSEAARRAGASIVVDHHPHVVSGLSLDGHVVTAWSMGNLLFDQTVWPTFESYLLDVDLRDGRPIRAYTEPLIVDGFTPRGVGGELADHVAREAAGRTPIPATFDDGAMEIDMDGRARHLFTRTTLSGPSDRGTVYRLGEGDWLSSFRGPGRVELGRDLLWVGSFEDADTDSSPHDVPLWDLSRAGVESGSDYAFSGSSGVRLSRHAGDCADAVVSPLHRMLLERGPKLTVLGMVRAGPDGGAAVQLSWYADRKGSSFSRVVDTLPPGDGHAWRPFRLDVSIPPGTVGVGLYLRQSAPVRGVSVTDWDDLRVIQWAPLASPPSPLYEFVRVTGSAQATVQSDVLPGGDTSSRPRIVPVAPGEDLSAGLGIVGSGVPPGCQTGE